MHASTLAASWRHFRDQHWHAAADAPARAALHIADNPIRARIRSVRWLPLIVPAMALFLLAAIGVIGTLL